MPRGTAGAMRSSTGTEALRRGTVPPRALEIDGAATAHPHAFAFEQLALQVHELTVAAADAPCGIEDAVPGHDPGQRSAELAESGSDGARGARPTEHGGDLAVGSHFATRNSPH